MLTYQDWLQVADKSDDMRIEFVKRCINEHKADAEVLFAKDAMEYDEGMNPTILRYEKFIYNAFGQKVPDLVSANHKIASSIFKRINNNIVSVQLGNGISWSNQDTEKKLQNSRHLFLNEMVELFRTALVQKCAYGFWNLDHLETFEFIEFKALPDEEDGAIKAGVKFWQIDETKPLRATLYELDGYTELIWRKDKSKGEIYEEKRPYILSVRTNAIDGEEIYDGMNYPTFPIIPLYLNKSRRSTLQPLRNKIDALDLITSGYVNDEDDMNVLYWTVTNAGGMGDSDLVETLDKLRKLHITQTDDDQRLEAHTVDMPYLGREAILDRLEKQIYKDAMTFNPYDLASGAVTATQIMAAYEPLNEQLDIYEVYLTGFITQVLELAGIDDKPTYDRSIVVNKAEEVNTLVNAAMYLDEQYITEKIMRILGDADKIEKFADITAARNLMRMTGGNNQDDIEIE